MFFNVFAVVLFFSVVFLHAFLSSINVESPGLLHTFVNWYSRPLSVCVYEYVCMVGGWWLGPGSSAFFHFCPATKETAHIW